MSKAVLNLETLACPTCMQKIEGAIRQLDGVEKESVKVLFNASKVKVNFDSKKVRLTDIEDAIEAIGYSVLKSVEKSI